VETLPVQGLEKALELWWFFFGPMVAHLYSGMVTGHEMEISAMFREYLSVALLKTAPTVDEFMNACVERDTVRAALLRQMGDVRILLSPVCLAPAFRHGEGNYQPGTGYRDTMRHSQWLNLAGFPGASVPIGFSAVGGRMRTNWCWPSRRNWKQRGENGPHPRFLKDDSQLPWSRFST